MRLRRGQAPPHGALAVRLLADTSKGERVEKYDPDTGEKILVNPATGKPEPWPLLGMVMDGGGEPPERTTVSVGFLRRHAAHGTVGFVGSRLVHRPGGPPEDPWRVTHTFEHFDEVVFRFLDGHVRYRVTRQPDKEHPNRPGEPGAVDASYELTRI